MGRDGGGDDRDAEVAKLVESCLPMLFYHAHAFKRSFPELEIDEIASVGCIALVKAARSYDGRAKFSTWAYDKIRWAIVEELSERSRRSTLRRDVAQLRETHAPKLYDLGPCRVDDHDEVEFLLRHLEPRTRAILIDTVVHGDRLEDAARRQGLSQARASQLRLRALAILRRVRDITLA